MFEQTEAILAALVVVASLLIQSSECDLRVDVQRILTEAVSVGDNGVFDVAIAFLEVEP